MQPTAKIMLYNGIGDLCEWVNHLINKDSTEKGRGRTPVLLTELVCDGDLQCLFRVSWLRALGSWLMLGAMLGVNLDWWTMTLLARVLGLGLGLGFGSMRPMEPVQGLSAVCSAGNNRGSWKVLESSTAPHLSSTLSLPGPEGSTAREPLGRLSL